MPRRSIGEQLCVNCIILQAKLLVTQPLVPPSHCPRAAPCTLSIERDAGVVVDAIMLATVAYNPCKVAQLAKVIVPGTSPIDTHFRGGLSPSFGRCYLLLPAYQPFTKAAFRSRCLRAGLTSGTRRILNARLDPIRTVIVTNRGFELVILRVGRLFEMLPNRCDLRGRKSRI